MASVARLAFLWLQGGMHQGRSCMVLACLQSIFACTILPFRWWLFDLYYFHMQSRFYFLYSRACEITVCYAISVCKYAFCSVDGLPIICVCGLCLVSAEGEFREGHHCVRIIMKIQNPDWPGLSICHCCLFVPYSFFFVSFYSLPSPRKCFFFTLAHYFDYIWQSSWISSSSHVVCLKKKKSETRDLLVLLMSEFQVAVVSCTVALDVGLKREVWMMGKALMELKHATEHEILKSANT